MENSAAGGIEKSVERAYAYLSGFDFSKIGMDYSPTNYPFRIPYPDSENLGRTGIAAYMLDAFLSIEKSGICSLGKKRDDFTNFLIDRREPDNLWSFDDFRYSIDADTTLIVSISLLNSGINEGSLKPTRDSLLRDFRTKNAFSSFKDPDPDHSNSDPHVEVTSNALYFLKLIGGMNNAEIGALEDWIAGKQHENGFWESYWYPSLYLGTYRAVRALEYSTRIRFDVLSFLKSSQNKDGGWGFPDSSALDSAYALLTFQFDPCNDSECEKGVEYLLKTQNHDGSWNGTTVFYYYYPELPGKSGREGWHTRQKKLISTALAAKCLSEYALKAFNPSDARS